MPTKNYVPKALTDDAVAILNVTNNASGARFFERDSVTEENLNDVCRMLFDYDLANDFYAALVNQIGLIIFNRRRWLNPLKLLKHGRLERGQIIEEIFVGLIKSKPDTISAGVTDVFDVNKPEVQAAFYQINWKQKYPLTINYTELESAFLNAQALVDFVQVTIGRVYDSYEIDEYKNTKNIMEEWGRRNNYKLVLVDEPDTAANLENLVIEIKAAINEAKFPRTDNNPAQVENWLDNNDLSNVVIFLSARVDAAISVKVLASAFNMDEVTFMRSGIKIIVDDFGTLENVVAIVASRDAFKIFDRDISISDMWNGSNRTRNLWLHVWQVYAASPFEPAYAFVTDFGSISSVTVAPETPVTSYEPGESYKLVATVKGTGMFDKAVAWSVTGDTMGTGTSITADGLLTIGSDATGTLTVKAITVNNPSGVPAVTGTLSITVATA